MNEDEFSISEIRESDKLLVNEFVKKNWGSTQSVSRGNVFDITRLKGYICKQNNIITGLITYHINGPDCEIVTLDSTVNNKGLATQLINKVVREAKQNKCERVWLITTNDNIKAIRFYQRRGFEWTAFYRNAMGESRKLKPEIPQLGHDGIPIKHEIEFEYRLTKPQD